MLHCFREAAAGLQARRLPIPSPQLSELPGFHTPVDCIPMQFHNRQSSLAVDCIPMQFHNRQSSLGHVP